MIPCRIVFHTLPDLVLEDILRLDEAASDDPRWRLLRFGNTRRTYQFSPGKEGPAWVVKWGCRYTSGRKVWDALRGRDQATVEWEKTERARQCGLPVLEFKLLAAPRFLKGRLNSLLVTEYLEDSRNFIQFYRDFGQDHSLLETALRNLGRIVAEVHSHHLLHRDLSLDNVLVRGNNPSDILLIGWFKMWELAPGDETLQWTDLVAPLSDMFYLGMSPRQMRPFLEGYAEKGLWLRGRFEEMLERGKKDRMGIMRRAYRKCNQRLRSIIRYRKQGYRVFLLKSADEKTVD